MLESSGSYASFRRFVINLAIMSYSIIVKTGTLTYVLLFRCPGMCTVTKATCGTTQQALEWRSMVCGLLPLNVMFAENSVVSYLPS